MMALLGASGCDSDGPIASLPEPTVVSLAIGGDSSISIGSSSQLTAAARFSDGTTRNVASRADWQSSDIRIATVSGTGVVAGVASGSATITATYGGMSDQVTVTVTPSAATVTAVAIAGTPTITVGQTIQLALTATFSDGTTREATSFATWQSTRPTFATVSKTGVVAALSPGTAVIIAAYEGQATSISIVVTAFSPTESAARWSRGRAPLSLLSRGARPSP